MACSLEVPTSVRADGFPFLLRGAGLGRHRLPESRAFLRREEVPGLPEEGQRQGAPSLAPAGGPQRTPGCEACGPVILLSEAGAVIPQSPLPAPSHRPRDVCCGVGVRRGSREGLGTDGAARCRGPEAVTARRGLREAQVVSQPHLLCVGREAQLNRGPDAGRDAPRCLVRADAGGWGTPASLATPRWSTEPPPAALRREGTRPPSLRTCFPRLVPLHFGPESQDRWPARALVRGGEGRQGRRVRGESGGGGRAVA